MSSWLKLVKYKLSLAVTLTGVAGYIIYANSFGIEILISGAGIFFLACGASSLNQYQEHEFDSLMTRTNKRPIPSGAISKQSALLLSVLLIIIGAILLLFLGWIPFALGLLNILFYNLLYTRLKRISYLAILPGAMVGAIPPLIGWTSAGGNIFNPTIIFLSTLIFMWQIPHFWLLIIKYHKEYEKAGFKTLLKVFNEYQVRRVVFVWIAVSSLFAMTYFYFGIDINIIFSYIILLANIAFILVFYFLLFRSGKEISRAFVLSNIFITTIFIILAAGALL
jgi:protoheme IX farnesyltransferase